MIISQSRIHRSLTLIFSGIVLLAAGCTTTGGSSGSAAPAAASILTGAQEVPPNPSSASGTSLIKIADDKAVSGLVTFSGMTATAAHIHEGAKGANGGVIVPLTKTSDTTFSVPADAKLTDSQYASYKTGDLYVNVHSAAYPGGEIRTQLIPK